MAARLRRRFANWARPRQPEALPVRIDRRRVYVLPTRFGLFFALLFLFLRVLPMISIFEMRTLLPEAQAHSEHEEGH